MKLFIAIISYPWLWYTLYLIFQNDWHTNHSRGRVLLAYTLKKNQAKTFSMGDNFTMMLFFYNFIYFIEFYFVYSFFSPCKVLLTSRRITSATLLNRSLAMWSIRSSKFRLPMAKEKYNLSILTSNRGLSTIISGPWAPLVA